MFSLMHTSSYTKSLHSRDSHFFHAFDETLVISTLLRKDEKESGQSTLLSTFRLTYTLKFHCPKQEYRLTAYT